MLQFPQGGFYILCCILSAGCLIVALQDEAGQRALAWSSPIAVIVFLVALVFSVRGAGINVASQFAQAFAGDPHALQFGLFRAAFRTVEPNVRSSVRHSVFGGVMIVLYVGVVASWLSNYLRKTQILCLVLCVPLVIFSLSRSVELGVALTALVAVLRVLLSGRVKVAAFFFGFAAIGMLPLLLPKLIPLFSAKLASTSSYDTRLGAIGTASHQFIGRLILGGPNLDSPTQLLIIDVLQRAGLVAGLAAVVVNLVVIATLIRLVALYWRTGEIVLLAAIGADIHVLIRTFTGGGNLMSMVEWLGFALVIAVSYLMTERGDMVAGGLAFRIRRKSLLPSAEPQRVPASSNGHHDPSALNGHATTTSTAATSRRWPARPASRSVRPCPRPHAPSSVPTLVRTAAATTADEAGPRRRRAARPAAGRAAGAHDLALARAQPSATCCWRRSPSRASTWLRFVLASALAEREMDYDLVARVSPPLGRQRVGPLIVPGGGRFVRSHEPPYFTPGAAPAHAAARARRTRHRVVAVPPPAPAGTRSTSDFDAFLPLFLEGRVGSYGSWQAHTRAWLATLAKASGTHVLTYERLLADPQAALAEVVAVFGLGLDAGQIAAALEQNSTDRMRGKEASSVRVQSRTKDASISFVREARAGGWREQFTAAQSARVRGRRGRGTARAGLPARRLVAERGDRTGRDALELGQVLGGEVVAPVADLAAPEGRAVLGEHPLGHAVDGGVVRGPAAGRAGCGGSPRAAPRRCRRRPRRRGPRSGSPRRPGSRARAGNAPAGSRSARAPRRRRRPRGR